MKNHCVVENILILYLLSLTSSVICEYGASKGFHCTISSCLRAISWIVLGFCLIIRNKKDWNSNHVLEAQSIDHSLKHKATNKVSTD